MRLLVCILVHSHRMVSMAWLLAAAGLIREAGESAGALCTKNYRAMNPRDELKIQRILQKFGMMAMETKQGMIVKEREGLAIQ